MIEAMAGRHISEAELARDVHAVLESVRRGNEIVVEQGHQPIAILKSASDHPHRKISECIAMLSLGSTAVIDPDFAADVEIAIAAHRYREGEHSSAPPWSPTFSYETDERCACRFIDGCHSVARGRDRRREPDQRNQHPSFRPSDRRDGD